MPTPPLIPTEAVAPALEAFTGTTLMGDLWQRAGLSQRDRSIVTLTVLIARNAPQEMAHYMDKALDQGVYPHELSEMITHLAFYAGWSNAMGAVQVAAPLFKARDITAAQLPSVAETLLPLDQAAEDKRATTVEANFGTVSPGVVHFTGEVLFRNLWLRPALKPRDRSLVTVVALIATGQFAQITYHLNRAMDNGLTHAEASEVLTHCAFYTGWPNVFSAMPVVKEVFASRASSSSKEQ